MLMAVAHCCYTMLLLLGFLCTTQLIAFASAVKALQHTPAICCTAATVAADVAAAAAAVLQRLNLCSQHHVYSDSSVRLVAY
jgi:hypothetical protein